VNERVRVRSGTHTHIHPLDVLAYELHDQLVQEPLNNRAASPTDHRPECVAVLG
jgi:hypothetical protein